MNKVFKIGLIGFSSVIGLAIFLRLGFDISTIFVGPFALPFGMLVIIGALRKKN